MLDECNTSTVPELLEVSADMLETVVLMANSLNRTICSPRDLPGLVIFAIFPPYILES